LRVRSRHVPTAMTETNVATIANIIQLAVAPVFLLAGIGGILNVVAHRLARVVARVPSLYSRAGTPAATARALRPLSLLPLLIRLCHRSLALFFFSAFLFS